MGELPGCVEEIGRQLHVNIFVCEEKRVSECYFPALSFCVSKINICTASIE